MTAEHILDAVGLLDDGLIREAEEYAVRKRRPGYGRWMGLAASFAVVIVLGYWLSRGIGMGGAAHDKASGGAASAPAASFEGMLPEPGDAQSGDVIGDAPTGNESDVPLDNQGDYCAAIMVDGTLYWSTGTPVPGEVAEEAIWTVTGYTDTVPEEDGQTNFSRDLSAQYAMTDRGLVVLIDREWILFDPVPPWEQ